MAFVATLITHAKPGINFGALCREESMCLHTITLASGTIQVSVLAGFAYGANRPYDTSKDAVLAVILSEVAPPSLQTDYPTHSFCCVKNRFAACRLLGSCLFQEALPLAHPPLLTKTKALFFL